MDVKDILESSTKYNFAGVPTGRVERLSENEALYYENGSGVGVLIGVYGDTVSIYDSNNLVESLGSYDDISDTVRMFSTKTGLGTSVIGENEDGDLYSTKIGTCFTSTYVSSESSCIGFGGYGNYDEEEANYELYGNYDGYCDDDDY